MLMAIHYTLLKSLDFLACPYQVFERQKWVGSRAKKKKVKCKYDRISKSRFNMDTKVKF